MVAYDHKHLIKLFPEALQFPLQILKGLGKESESLDLLRVGNL